MVVSTGRVETHDQLFHALDAVSVEAIMAYEIVGVIDFNEIEVVSGDGFSNFSCQSPAGSGQRRLYAQVFMVLAWLHSKIPYETLSWRKNVGRSGPFSGGRQVL